MVRGDERDHYGNRIEGHDVDLTSEQFRDDEEIREIDGLDAATIRARSPGRPSELAARIAVLRGSVDTCLADIPATSEAVNGG